MSGVWKIYVSGADVGKNKSENWKKSKLNVFPLGPLKEKHLAINLVGICLGRTFNWGTRKNASVRQVKLGSTRHDFGWVLVWFLFFYTPLSCLKCHTYLYLYFYFAQ